MLARYVNRISCRCLIYFPTISSSVHEAVSSLALGAGVSAAFYAATTTCFFLKDCHGKILWKPWYHWSPPPQCWSQADFGPDPFIRALNLYASSATPPNEAQLRKSDTNGAHSDLQDIPQDLQTPNIYITFQKVTLWLAIAAGSTWGGGSATCQSLREDTVSIVCILVPIWGEPWNSLCLTDVFGARLVNLRRFQLHRLERYVYVLLLIFLLTVPIRLRLGHYRF